MNSHDIGAIMDSVEYAGSMLDRHDFNNNASPNLLEVTGISQHRMATASGLNDYDYQPMSSLTQNESIRLNQLESVSKVPIPPEVMEHFKHIKCHCMMGLFPEIDRAWLTIDSDIYIWTYENARDVAYFDGLNHLILSVGLVKPKPNVFIADIKYLLIITTPIEIVVLGVVFSDSASSKAKTSSTISEDSNYLGEMQLMDKPIFVINTDNVAITSICGTDDYRIFMGARDGSIYEIYYQAESNWFGKRCKKINHSQGLLSYIVPGFLKVFSEMDSINKIVVDNSRKLLYTLSEKGAIEAWDLGLDHNSTTRFARISANDIANQANNIIKTVDESVFNQVVSLCPLTQSDSPHLHLLAITQGGVRIYFSTTPLHLNASTNQQAQPGNQVPVDPSKPQNLYLLHVRLPPGYTSNVSVVKPKSVHSVFYKQGTLLMVSTPQQDQDLLWSLSSEPFPMRPYLAESSTVIPLNGQVWSIGEVRSAVGSDLHESLCCSKTNRRVVLLTNQGAHIVALMKPVDMLQQLLIACHGPHHESVKAYFHNQSEQEACATSVLLACSSAFKGTDVAMWATQAFILYGGEPTYGSMTSANFMNNQSVSRNFSNILNEQVHRSPMFMSTPMVGTRQVSVVQQNLMQQQTQNLLSPVPPINQQQQNSSPQLPNKNNYQTSPDHPVSSLLFSSKHNGLYLHVIRMLRPLWKKKCLAVHSQSSITFQDCAEVLDDLYAVRAFIESLPMNNATGFMQTFGNESSMAANQYAVAFGGQNTSYNGRNSSEIALIEEKRSVGALVSFIKHTTEVLALWKILCEHQFRLLIQALPNEELQILGSCTFRDLIMSRTEICAQLIVALINSYLKDNASVSSISEKLRDVCPNIYRHEDAVSNKATEILMTSKSCADAEEQKEKLQTALQLCKDAAPHLPLPVICQQFRSANFYQGVIELCSTCADKIDPNGSALHYYKSKEPSEDQEGYIAFTARMLCYKEVTLTLDHIYSTLNNNNNRNLVCNTPKAAKDKNNYNNAVLEIVALALQTHNTLLHIAVYDWLLAHKLHSELLNIVEPSLGEFLTHSFERNPENLYLADILWKYHERNAQHPAATNILDQLASMQSSMIPLSQRIEYLARAVMCMRCDNVGYSTHNGILLKNLEDKLEIARVQKLLLDAIDGIRSPEAQEASQHLNSMLYNITELYTLFSEPFQLWECKLTILNCSHHNDSLLIESVWMQILDAQISGSGSVHEKSVRLLSKVHTLANELATSSHCFPVPFLAHELEVRCCQLRLPASPVPEALIAMSLDIDELLDVYGRMISMNERVWASAGNEWHLVQATTKLVSLVISQPALIGVARNRRRLVSKAQDLTSSCRNLLYPKPDTKPLIDALIEIEAKLQRV